MKNIFKLFGIVALVTVIGFSVAGCAVDPKETYSAIIFHLEDDKYLTVIGEAAPDEDDFNLLDSTMSSVYEKVDKAYMVFDNNKNGIIDDGGWLLLSDIESVLAKTYHGMDLTSDQQGQILDELKNKGYVMTSYGTDIGAIVFAAVRE